MTVRRKRCGGGSDVEGVGGHDVGVVEEELATANFQNPDAREAWLEAMREPRRRLEAEALDDDDGPPIKLPGGL